MHFSMYEDIAGLKGSSQFALLPFKEEHLKQFIHDVPEIKLDAYYDETYLKEKKTNKKQYRKYTTDIIILIESNKNNNVCKMFVTTTFMLTL